MPKSKKDLIVLGRKDHVHKIFVIVLVPAWLFPALLYFGQSINVPARASALGAIRGRVHDPRDPLVVAPLACLRRRHLPDWLLARFAMRTVVEWFSWTPFVFAVGAGERFYLIHTCYLNLNGGLPFLRSVP